MGLKGPDLPYSVYRMKAIAVSFRLTETYWTLFNDVLYSVLFLIKVSHNEALIGLKLFLTV